jgi:hypothetical protein
MHLVHHGNSVSETRHDLRPQLETKVKMLGTNVEKEIAWCGNGMAPGSADLAERVQLYRSRLTEEPVPGIRPKAQDARKAGIHGSKCHGAQKGGQVAAQGAHPRARIGAWVDVRDEKERGAS